MKRSQWFVFGVGLILLSFFISIASGSSNACSELHESSLELGSIDSNPMDAWVISCFDKETTAELVSAIVATVGILSVICGFLEPKMGKK